METPPPTDTKAEVQPKDFVTATLPINPESTELLFAWQATINCDSGDQERGVTLLVPLVDCGSGTTYAIELYS